MSPTPGDLESVYRVLARTYPRAAPFWIIAKAARPLSRATTRQALHVLCEHGLARTARPGQYAATRLSGPPARQHRGRRV
jgi:hypothetical protein